MSQAFAKPFYNSNAWKKCRDSYFVSKYGLCELCERPGEEVHHKIFITTGNINDTKITLDHENLMLLCKNCHNEEHNRAYEMHREKNRKTEVCNREVCFDEDGNLIQKKNVFIVHGAPASGKTTYVKEHKGKYDIVFDLDYIISALSLHDNNKGSINDCVDFAIDLREHFYSIIETRALFFENVWVTVGMPNKDNRISLAKRLRAELIHIDTDIETCKQRAKVDENRRDKQKQYNIIDYYFKMFEK